MATVQTRSGHSGTSPATVAITTTAGNLLAIVTGSFNGNGGAPTRTGETNNNAIAPFADAGLDNLRGDYMMNIGGNNNTVSGNGSALNGTSCCVSEMSGRATTSALGSVSHAVSAASTVQPGSITPTAGSDLMTGTADDGSGTAASTISDSTNTYTVDEIGGTNTVWDAGGAIGGSAHSDNVPATATNPTWTSGHTGGTVAHMAALIMEFLAAGGAAAPVPPLLLAQPTQVRFIP